MSITRFSFATLILILLCVVTTSEANTNQNYCSPSSCGHIQNISFPFRLKTDLKTCGAPGYELACENNQTVLYLNSKRYYVQSITYQNYTIRLLDPGIRKNKCPSFPLHSFTSSDIPIPFRPRLSYNYIPKMKDLDYMRSLNAPATFISCSNIVESSLYVDTASCNAKTTSNSSSLKEYSYVLLGDQVRVADVEDSCTIDKVSWVSTEFPIIDKTSFLSILDAMANGFSLRWSSVYCEHCEARNGKCYLDYEDSVKCHYNCFSSPPTNIREFYDCLENNLLLIFSVSTYIVLFFFAKFLCGLPCLFVLLHYKNRGRHLSVYDSIEDFLQGHNNLVPIRYKYSDIKKMTKNFNHKLGEGGYGSVFKGKLRSGLFVAVKMMNKSKASSGQDFINEVATIGRIHHANVVRLIGFCVEGSKRALVYEFMPNGSLEKYIFSREETIMSLSYEKMFAISLGVARGIDYIHRGCEMQILHFDIKPHNILLDDNFNPKVSDFGLAKLYSTDDSIVSLTAARGTMGYMAPELFYKNIGGVSYKADVYSYGMLLLEMAGKRKNLNPFAENLSQIYFPSWVYDQLNEGKEIGTGDTSGEEKEMIKKMIIVGLWCIQMKPIDRPSMNKVVEMLEGEEQHLRMPPKPFLVPGESPDEEDHEIHVNDNHELPLISGDFIYSTSLDRDEE